VKPPSYFYTVTVTQTFLPYFRPKDQNAPWHAQDWKPNV